MCTSLRVRSGDGKNTFLPITSFVVQIDIQLATAFVIINADFNVDRRGVFYLFLIKPYNSTLTFHFLLFCFLFFSFCATFFSSNILIFFSVQLHTFPLKCTHFHEQPQILEMPLAARATVTSCSLETSKSIIQTCIVPEAELQAYIKKHKVCSTISL